MISVIVPLYNCDKYIKECLESLLQQTYTNFEIIVVNDGSTDNSENIVKQFQDEKITIINQENRGLFHTRISGLKAAKGDICMFLDADDILNKEALETVQEYFTNGYDCIIYKLASFSQKDEKTYHYEQAIFSHNTCFQQTDRNHLLSILFTSGKLNSIVCKAFKKELIDVKKLSQYPRIAIGEDALFTLELFTNMTRTIYLDSILYYYRQQAESLSHNLTENIYFDNVFRFNLYREIAEKFFFGEELKQMKERIDFVVIKMTTAMALNDRYVVPDYQSFGKIFQKVSADSFLIDAYNRVKTSKKRLFTIIVMLIIKGHLKTVFKLRGLYRIIKRMRVGKLFFAI